MRRKATFPAFIPMGLSLALLSMACGGKSSRDGADDQDKFGPTYLNHPQQLPLADNACQESQGLTLTNRSVREVFYGLHMRQTQEQLQDDSRIQSLDDLIMVQKARQLMSCPVAEDSRSVEGVARLTMDQLDEITRFYGALPKAKAVDNLSLLVLPLYEYASRQRLVTEGAAPQERKERGFITDNASWSLSRRGPMVTIYPQSEERANRQERPLWEMPLTLAHEYGHDVFHRHFPRIFADVSAKYTATTERMDALVFNDNDEVAHLRHNALSDQDGKAHATLSMAITALNEGMADLFGFYAIGQKADALPIRCFGESRDIMSPHFSDGVAKIIDQNALMSFVQQENLQQYPTSVPECERTRWYQVHIFGAALAHGVNQVYEALGLHSANDKASKLLAWMDLMNKNYQDGVLGTTTFFDFALRQLSLSATDGKLSPAFCQAMQAQFPVFTSLWRTDGPRRFQEFKDACPAS